MPDRHSIEPWRREGLTIWAGAPRLQKPIAHIVKQPTDLETEANAALLLHAADLCRTVHAQKLVLGSCLRFLLGAGPAPHHEELGQLEELAAQILRKAKVP